MSNKASLIIAVFFVIIVNLMIFFRIGLVPALIIGGSAFLALIVWMTTTYKNPVNPDKILPIYLIAVAAQIIHTGEEYISDFPFHLTQQFNLQNFDRNTFAILVLVIAAAIWVLTGYGLIKKSPLANYFLWFFLIGPGIVNSVAHFTFIFLADGRYFPGLITVLLPTVLSILIIRKIFKNIK